MARTVDHVERISESFDELDSMSQADMVIELFSRLEPAPKEDAWRRLQFGARLAGLIPEKRRRDAEVPPLMDREEVERNGKLALHEGPKQ